MTIVYLQPQPKFGPYRYNRLWIALSASTPEGSAILSLLEGHEHVALVLP